MSAFRVDVPNFPGYVISADGELLHRHAGIVYPGMYQNGELKFTLDSDVTGYIQTAPCWKVMLDSFYSNVRIGIEPEFVDGDRRNHSLDNLIFGEANDETGLWEPLRWTQVGQIRRIDRRLGRQIRVNETGSVYNSLEEVARAIGGQKQNVSACLNGRLKSHCGRTFSYV